MMLGAVLGTPSRSGSIGRLPAAVRGVTVCLLRFDRSDRPSAPWYGRSPRAARMAGDGDRGLAASCSTTSCCSPLAGARAFRVPGARSDRAVGTGVFTTAMIRSCGSDSAIIHRAPRWRSAHAAATGFARGSCRNRMPAYSWGSTCGRAIASSFALLDALLRLPECDRADVQSAFGHGPRVRHQSLAVAIMGGRIS